MGLMLSIAGLALADEAKDHEIPLNVAATCAVTTATVTWDAVNNQHLSGYLVFRGISSDGPWTQLTPSPITVTTHFDSGLSSGSTYYWVTKATYDDGHVSAYSAPGSCTTG